MSASPQPSKPSPAPPGLDRRRHARHRIVDDQIVAITLDGDNGGLVLDLAEEGLAVQAVAPLQQGKSTEMSFVLPDSKTSIHAHGEVRWADESGRAGIRLLAFSQGSSAAIRAALLQPAPAPVEPAPPKRLEPAAQAIDAAHLEREIAARQLDREGALAFLAERSHELAAASGLAIALGSRQEMICVASAGAAPGIGVRLNSDSGLSGECVRTGTLVRSDDTEDDPRVDAAVCRQLGLRSAVLVPILDSGKLCGVLEVFSGRPRAFSEDDIRRFEQLAGLVAKLTRKPPVEPAVAKPAAAEVTPILPAVPLRKPTEAPVAESLAEEEPSITSPPRVAPPAAKYALAVCGVIGLAAAGWGVLHRGHTASPQPAVAPVATPVAAAVPVETPPQPVPETVVAARATKKEATKTAKPSSPAVSEKPSSEAMAPAAAEDELAVRKLPALAPANPSDDAAPPALAVNSALPNLAAPRIEPLRPGQSVPGVVVGRLVHKVDPTYPDAARRAHVGGSVVLSAVIRPDGKVGTVEVLSGNPLLARAAVEAVRQWRYEPFTLHGIPVQAESTIRLNFHP